MVETPAAVDLSARDASWNAFAEYACAGTQQWTGPMQGAGYVSKYNKQLSKILELPPDTLMGQVKALVAFAEAKVVVIPVPEADDGEKAEKKCREDVKALLKVAVSTPPGQLSLEGPLPLALIPAIDMIKALGKAAEQAAKDALKIAVEVQRRHQLTEFVKANRDSFNRNMSSNLASARLEKAWELRRAATLYRAYLSFAVATAIKPEAAGRFSPGQAVQITKSFSTVDAALAEFDAMAVTPSPAEFAKAVKSSHDALFALATNEKISLEEFIGFLTAMSEMVDAVRNDWDALAAAAEKARKASP
jgi:hypothetical protein